MQHLFINHHLNRLCRNQLKVKMICIQDSKNTLRKRKLPLQFWHHLKKTKLLLNLSSLKCDTHTISFHLGTCRLNSETAVLANVLKERLNGSCLSSFSRAISLCFHNLCSSRLWNLLEKPTTGRLFPGYLEFVVLSLWWENVVFGLR